MFIAFLHCKNCVYLCIYDLFHIQLSYDTLTDPWNTGMYVKLGIHFPHAYDMPGSYAV
jgi:hypothetical protein